MSDFRSPIEDITFTLRHVADLDALAKLEGYEHADPDLIDGLVAEAGRFFDEVVAPTNRDGDTVGTKLNEDGSITTAPGFAEAYGKLVESGWNGIGFPEVYGGGGFPQLLSTAVEEMTTTANMAFALGPLLSRGAIEAIMHHGDESQKEIYLQKLVSGEWTGTMNLTEPHAGSDVGALTSKAEPADDGTWRIFGQKIFITWGEHDVADNIVHLVLARTPGSPPGTKGISLFIVPKFLVNDDGTLGERNDLTLDALLTMAVAGEVQPSDFVRKPNGEWAEASTLRPLRRALGLEGTRRDNPALQVRDEVALGRAAAGMVVAGLGSGLLWWFSTLAVGIELVPLAIVGGLFGGIAARMAARRAERSARPRAPAMSCEHTHPD